MRGSLKKRSDGKYKIWIELSRLNEKRRRETHVVAGTRKEAEAYLRRRVSEIESGAGVEIRNLKLRDALERWLEASKGNVEPKTFDRYAGVVRKNLIPVLGDVKLEKLRPLHVEQALRQWANAPRQDHKKGNLSARTVHHIYSTLRAALRYAVRLELIPKSPADAVHPPKKGTASICDLDENGATKLLEALRGTPLYAPALIALLTGMRRGELLGLTWEAVDFDRAELHVRHSLECIGGQLRFKEPKTARSRRTLPLAPLAIETLRAHRAAQDRLGTTIGADFNKLAVVFCNPATGQPWLPDKFGSAFYYLARQAGIHASFHALRHSNATIALRSGADLKTVSTNLGHSNISITADLYVGRVSDLQRGAANLVGDALQRASAAIGS